MAAPPIFERIVELCGLSEVLGPGIVRRSLGDIGTEPDSVDLDEWRKVLPELEKRLRAYMAEDEAALRVQRIAALVGRAEAGTLTPNPDRPGRKSNPGRSRLSMTTPNPD